MIRVEIDANSGFCGGVIKAIGTAEKYLDNNGGPLFSLGAIVHNEQELSRLSSLGLKTIASLEEAENQVVLIRAHGEPPYIYKKASELGCKIIDCTCPVVLNLQKQIRKAYARVSERRGNIVLYGKEGHPEVLGLVGQVEGKVIVVPDFQRLKELIEKRKIELNRDIELFSQTTMSPLGYAQLAAFLNNSMRGGKLTIHNTICSQVANRHSNLESFAHEHDVLLFVAGQSSSNGKVLSDLCRRVNERTYFVNSVEDIRKEWFKADDLVGVCGATSTPSWLLEKLASEVKNLF